jgi:hypothetical protein
VRDALGGSQDVSALPLTPARVRAMTEAAPPAAAASLTHRHLMGVEHLPGPGGP